MYVSSKANISLLTFFYLWSIHWYKLGESLSSWVNIYLEEISSGILQGSVHSTYQVFVGEHAYYNIVNYWLKDILSDKMKT